MPTSSRDPSGSGGAAREVRLAEIGSLDQLKLHRRAIPKPGAGQVVVQVKAASLNYRDTLVPFGTYQKPPYGVGVVPLSDGAGTIHAIGADVTGLKLGQRVTANCMVKWVDGPIRAPYIFQQIGMDMDGWLADYCLIDAQAVVPIPDYMSFEEAATLPCAAVTAATALASGPIHGSGQVVLVLGTGGVSLFALQIAKQFGAQVVATTSTAAKMDRLRALGADFVVNYVEQPDWAREVRAFTGGEGVDLVVEVGGEATLANSFRALANRGHVSIVGYVGGRTRTLDPGALPPGSSLSRTVIGSRERFVELLGQMEAAEMRPVIDRVYPFEDFRQAYERLQSGQHMGKVVIKM